MDNTYKEYNEEISSTSTEKEPMVINREEPNTFSNSSANDSRSRIRVIDARKMMDPDDYKWFIKNFTSGLNSSLNVKNHCHRENCNNFGATICNKCKMARYCSEICRKRHWWSKHSFECHMLQKKN
ncbi:uncharacterized protein LOC100572177 [Acyrthosiphon pisum]|uniref:MYND-type domain-containing protein n=1 Tax=Acyrthosiphon pisum TaxID=7029 RepID=A0A8R2A958_ACYPI|nr:uncharacterized protein LOC100572177 [Acyrthosiphon pisum]|eukprot:XP_003243720.1 PREDICTED: uncharacterized protein LOC100572177 [Acyrthosiphon pisum]